MNMKRWLALGAAAILLVFSIGLNTVITMFTSDFFSDFDSLMSTETELLETVIEPGDFGERIALLSVNGTIQDVGSSTAWTAVEYDHQQFLAQLENILYDDSVKAVVLEVNSPGGGVIESAEIHEKLVEIKEQKNIPIYVSMGSMAASGGYYISAPADKIFAHRETLTGSIGVIMQSYNFSELAEKVGVKFETIKSGEHKDMFGGTRPTTDEERAMMQEMINDSYEVFVDVIEQGRGMSEADVKKVADGRILGGTQAVKAGLVDEIGGIEDTIASLRADFDLENAELFEYDTSFGDFTSLLGMKISSFFGPSAEERMLSKLMSSHDAPRMMYMYGEY
ncbi:MULTISPECIES: signal peptide peptidase SppA [Lysinibacillus]|uniref:Signal peptide peptidase SppA n=1 Tax=Lysinibacillus antri TaxID=2498145 RepID=A0A432LFJ5_9BACI|nr:MULTISPECIES: signal peptide peptidase SppA [Lysinibacillus]RUL56430.1 signal peptide peptidase SppA [Lysinibacillus antri]TSI03099.1 signal peptide peptidase SppA [Lysinibacillus sp. BW-2-10]